MKNPKERILYSLILLIFIFALFAVIVSSTTEMQLSAKSAALYEPKSGSFIYEKNANARMPMASTTKIMTALVALENSPKDLSVTISKNAAGVEGSSLYLKVGEVVSMRDLIYGLMLRSANDAAVAIAEAISGSVENFSALMNKKAKDLGLTDTHFENPHGLDSENHYTTAKELAIITAEALKNESFKEIVSTYKWTIDSSENQRVVINHNKLLKLYDGAIGVKTGFTKRSGRCLVGAAERDGLTFITVTIDAPSDWNDHRMLFDLGYSTMEIRQLAIPYQFTYSLPIIGSNYRQIKVSNQEAFSIVTEKENKNITSKVQLKRYTATPVSKGEVMGKVVFYDKNKFIGEINLYAMESIS